MMKWQALCAPKNVGGIGFVDGRAINQTLLCKWIYNIEKGTNSICYDLLRRKYNLDRGFFQIDPHGGHFFWKGLHKVKTWARLGCGFVVKKGTRVSFWHDVWYGDTPLKTQFHKIYELCHPTDLTVSETMDMYHTGGLLCRSLRPTDIGG
ncbi:hypothetical protein GUJ93_ZPchr0715g29018 [Zizania palustris]|uniref:Reverse transcriptase zinc-binding domain-containing protein n=1 Tax=Zizania palustris TaxID=103762 RepID=A0A8J5VEK1_ZIZPA|nr:hypothetical protein GUJ93_ZPchr0715g29018 [Zizania palustris]